MRGPLRLPASAAVKVEILSNVKVGNFHRLQIALDIGGFPRVKGLLLVDTQEIFQGIWSGKPIELVRYIYQVST